MTAPVLYIRDGSRFVPVDAIPLDRPLPPIPVPVRLDDHAPAHDALGRPAPACGRHIATWAAYTDPAGRPACKLCDSLGRHRAR